MELSVSRTCSSGVSYNIVVFVLKPINNSLEQIFCSFTTTKSLGF